MATTAHYGDDAMQLASHGWRVHPLQARDKRPLLSKWQEQATTDEEQIAEWWGSKPSSNIGIALGEASGIIDAECDQAGSEATLAKLLGDEMLITPTYQSRRGKHRILRWRGDLPDKAKIEIGPAGGKVEFRGCGSKGAYSVAPPSIHPDTHEAYQWLEGLSPEDVDVADIPKKLLVALWNLGGEDLIEERPKSQRMALYEQDSIPEGARDETLYKEACALWREQEAIHGEGCFDADTSQKAVYRRLWAWNQSMCIPPLEERVLLEKSESARSFIRAHPLDLDTTARSRGASLEALGLELRGGQHYPGLWRLETVNSDPPIMRIFAPCLPDKGLDLTPDEYDSAAHVHRKVLAVTGEIALDDGVRPWRVIWKGSNKNRKNPIRGLMAKLLDSATKIEAPAEQQTLRVVGEILLGYLARAKVLSDEVKPSIAWPFTEDGVTYFTFSRFQELVMESNLEIKRNQLSRAVRELGANKDGDKLFRLASGKGSKPVRFMGISAADVKLLHDRL